MSDLHLEFGGYKPNLPEADVFVLAGDIGVGLSAFPWIERTFVNNEKVIYIAGNHEFYIQKRTFFEQKEAMLEKAKDFRDNFWFLDNSSIEIDGVLFCGGTLWTDFGLFGNVPVCEQIAKNGVNDFIHIPLMNIDVWKSEHQKTKQFLLEQTEDPRKKVFITHHLPSELSVEEVYKSSMLSAAFASNLDNLMLYTDHSPCLWIHGHTHTPCDYLQGETRVVCNPRGYVGYENGPKTFEIKVVEI